ncbi:hypothetical protein [Brevundimonas sp.]|uniref:hypothetical protein n=1 Tax=Brevundimonas sp. TaxID=1871086 RepID=UPI003D112558
MSAAIVYLTADGAHLATDGAAFGDTGAEALLCQKVYIAAHLNAVVAARGPILFAELLGVLLRQAQGDFDSLAADFGNLGRQAHLAMTAAVEAGTAVVGDLMTVDAVLVGFSEKHGFSCYVASSTQSEVPDLKTDTAWQPCRLGATVLDGLSEDTAVVYVTPGDEIMAARLAKRGTDMWSPSGSIEQHALALMEDQRAFTPIVGGFCQLTSVMRSGVFTTILKRWPAALADAA